MVHEEVRDQKGQGGLRKNLGHCGGYFSTREEEEEIEDETEKPEECEAGEEGPY